MKKINIKLFTIIGVLLFSLVSCSSDDNDDSNNGQISINPPQWIQGKWLQEDNSTVVGYRFTSNDFITIVANVETSQREQLEAFANSGQSVSATDSSTDSTYSVTINTIGGQSTIYNFTKISDTEISNSQFDNLPIDVIFTKQ